MIINYGETPVEFHNLEFGGIDQRIKAGQHPVSSNEQAAFDALIAPQDVVYDIGAYIGSHSIYFALKDNLVHAFEPSTRNFYRAEKNCKPFKNIILHNVALHEREYTCETLFKDCNTSVSVDEIVQPIKYVNLYKYIWLRDLPLPDFIKMDCEGMESQILNTFNFLFEGSRPKIALDAHRNGKHLMQQRYEDNPSWLDPDEGGFDFNDLKNFNYNLYDCDDGSFKQISEKSDYNSAMGFKSFALIPKEKI